MEFEGSTKAKSRVPVCVVACICSWQFLIGCATPNVDRLSTFSQAQIQETAAQKGDWFDVKASRLGAKCLKDLFGTEKVSKGFTVYWVTLAMTGSTGAELIRNQISLTAEGREYYPVAPGRVAYIAKTETSGAASLAFISPVIALAAMEGVRSANEKRNDWTGTGALPETATLQAETQVSGFLYFEVLPSKSNARTGADIVNDFQLAIPLKVGDRVDSVRLTNIPEVNPTFEKEEKGDAKSK